MLGWSAVAGIVDWSIVTPMYFGGIAWGIMYDLIYAHQVSQKRAGRGLTVGQK